MKKFYTRKKLRLPEYNYAAPGSYYVTICAFKKDRLFGVIVDGIPVLNHCGKIIKKQLLGLPKRFPNIEIDTCVIMPNHVHIIITIINESVPLGKMIGVFKALCSRQCRKKIWQRNYYEHVIRNEKSLNLIRQYINENPYEWENDEYY